MRYQSDSDRIVIVPNRQNAFLDKKLSSYAKCTTFALEGASLKRRLTLKVDMLFGALRASFKKPLVPMTDANRLSLALLRQKIVSMRHKR
jgi:hypothetical protein